MWNDMRKDGKHLPKKIKERKERKTRKGNNGWKKLHNSYIRLMSSHRVHGFPGASQGMTWAEDKQVRDRGCWPSVGVGALESTAMLAAEAPSIKLLRLLMLSVRGREEAGDGGEATTSPLSQTTVRSISQLPSSSSSTPKSGRALVVFALETLHLAESASGVHGGMYVTPSVINSLM